MEDGLKNKGISISNVNNRYTLIGIYIISLVFMIINRTVIQKCTSTINIEIREFVLGLLIAFVGAAEIYLIATISKVRCNISFSDVIKREREELTTKRIVILTLIIMFSICLVSSQIGWQVKPFYDLGYKFTKYDLLAKVGQLIANIVKCAWLLLLIKVGQDLLENITKKKNFIWGGLLLLLTFGLYELIFVANELNIVYFILNIIFGLVYLLTDRSIIKSYLIILFIYIF